MEVHYAQCVVPDQFRDVKGVQVEVTAEGRLASDGHLVASKIFAKCPSKYEMKVRNRGVPSTVIRSSATPSTSGATASRAGVFTRQAAARAIAPIARIVRLTP